MSNKFINSLYSYDTLTENGALSHSNSGSELLNYFAKAGTYRDRHSDNIYSDLVQMWTESPMLTLQVIFYNRLISRKIKGAVSTESVQKGQGNRSEFRKCLEWLSTNHPEILYKNLWLVPMVGCWKDLWHAELVEVLDRAQVYQLIERGLADEYQRDLLAKYLPRIRSKSNIKRVYHQELNKFAFGLLKYLSWTPTQYRKFKSSGNAHVFQRQMGANEWNELDFNAIPGKALSQVVNNFGKDKKTTLKRHGIEERFVSWMKEQPTAKFTGYVYQLMDQLGEKPSISQKITADKQFEGLVELAKKDGQILRENIWCALDTSGSMKMPVADTSAYNICISLGIYFSTLNEGAFADQVIMFDVESRIKKLSGSFTEKLKQIQRAKTAWGNTNFQSVIDEIVRVRLQDPSVPVTDFPTTLIVVSDMQFDSGGDTQTNYELAMHKLAEVGLPKINIVWWMVTGRGHDFPNKMDDQGVMMLGGFDGSIISLLLGEKSIQKAAPQLQAITPYEAMLKALDQEILKELKL